jgi:AcrR family transcriptional regulator
MSSKRKSTPFQGQPLPRGRHGLDAKFVRASQRERLVKAMLALVAEHGYTATTVPEVVATARVSRNAFYDFFADKEECFLAACAEAGADLFSTMETFGVEDDWVEGTRRGIATYLRWWQDRPGLCRAYLVELPLIGARAAEQRLQAYAPFEEMFTRIATRIRRAQPRLAPLPSYVPRFLVIALLEYLATEVRAGRMSDLMRLEDAALFVTVKLLADDATAHAALRRRSSRARVVKRKDGATNAAGR